MNASYHHIPGLTAKAVRKHIVTTLKQVVIAVSAGTVLLSGCAHSIAVDRVKMGDTELTCSQILGEMQEADKFGQAAEGNKGVTGTNAAALLLFWPAIIATYSDANTAVRAAQDRKEYLARLYNEKGCTTARR